MITNKMCLICAKAQAVLPITDFAPSVQMSTECKRQIASLLLGKRP